MNYFQIDQLFNVHKVAQSMISNMRNTKPKQERHEDVVRMSNTCGRENRETGETVTLIVAQF